MKYKRKINGIGLNSYTLSMTIPKELSKKLGIKKDDEVLVYEKQGKIIVEKVVDETL